MGRVYYASFFSKIGTIYVASTEKGVCKISIPGQSKKEFLRWLEENTNGCELVESYSKNKQIIDELTRYFERRLVKFRSRIDLRGTEFQRRVWKALRHIPYGTTITYKQLAHRIGNERAFRAVGRANGENPLPIVIPCHRVIASDETLGGYAAGEKTKEFLLRLEGAISIENKKSAKCV
ncbi:MAG: methylated-DNA--[protein]-cysteine S-methyltransferase [Bacteroidetes bacterium]|nr:methylated-DNA--[protein]-cysteine S-methyltransferase [Bacteroidota bacterium]